MTTENVWLDSNTGNRTDELALHAVFLMDRRWNGWAVPAVTAAEFRRFITACAGNDPTGAWAPEGVSESNPGSKDATLIYDDAVSEADNWPRIGIIGNADLYAIDGWIWTR